MFTVTVDHGSCPGDLGDLVFTDSSIRIEIPETTDRDRWRIACKLTEEPDPREPLETDDGFELDIFHLPPKREHPEKHCIMIAGDASVFVKMFLTEEEYQNLIRFLKTSQKPGAWN